MFEYRAIVKSVHDGDTIVVDIDLGFKTWLLDQHLRIYGISARELWMNGGKEARDNLTTVLPFGTELTIHSYKLDKDPTTDMSFNRYVVQISTSGNPDLGQYLISTGWAVAWDGKKKPTPYPLWPRVSVLPSL